MIRRTRAAHSRALSALLVLAPFVVSAPALADEVSLDEEAASDEFVEENADQDFVEEKSSTPAPVVDEAIERPGQTYLSVGARYRAVILPHFMMAPFVSGGETVVAHSFGAEFGIRKDGFEIVPSVWFANYSLENVPFKAKNDPPTAWELIDSNLKILYFTADFLWSTDIAPKLSWTYGVGAGFGLVFGNITRNEAYFPNGRSNENGAGLRRCPGVSDPVAPGDAYCAAGGQYNYDEPSWVNGGSKPILFPWLAVQTGLRYKAHKNFVGRLDTGFGTSGFFVGLGADYGL